MTISLKSWVHPSSGEKRIYVNSPRFDRAIKIWIENRPSVQPELSGWEIMVKADYAVNVSAIKNDVSSEMQALGLSYKKFDELAA